jgi:hypothetical protein
LTEPSTPPTEPASPGSEPPSSGTPVVPLTVPSVPFYLSDPAPGPSDSALSFPEYLHDRNLVFVSMTGRTTLSDTFRLTCEALVPTAAQLAIHPQWSDNHILVPFGPRLEDWFCVLKSTIKENQSKQYSQLISVFDLFNSDGCAIARPDPNGGGGLLTAGGSVVLLNRITTNSKSGLKGDLSAYRYFTIPDLHHVPTPLRDKTPVTVDWFQSDVAWNLFQRAEPAEMTTEPADSFHPLVVQRLRLAGISPSDHSQRLWFHWHGPLSGPGSGEVPQRTSVSPKPRGL